MHYVYVLKSTKDGKLYIGVTNDLRRRFGEHNAKQSISTAHRGPFILVYYEAYQSTKDAHTRERRLKQFKNSYNELLKRLVNSLMV